MARCRVNVGGGKKFPELGATTYTPTTVDQVIAAEQTLTGPQTIKGDADLVSSNIKAGVSVFDVLGSNNVVDTSDANAAATDILTGHSGYVNGVKVTGTMTDRSTGAYATDLTTIVGNSLEASVPDSAYYGDAARITITDNDWVEANMKVGVNIFGKTGTFTNDATLTTSLALSGYTYYKNGIKYTGTMPNIAGSTKTTTDITRSGNYLRFGIPETGRYDTNGTLQAVDNDWIESNIKTGVNMFGKIGTYTNDATAIASNIYTGKTAYVNGSKITGSMPAYGSGYNTDSLTRSGNTLRMSVPYAGYYTDGAYVQSTDNDWIEANIKSGVNMFGKVGSYKGPTVSGNDSRDSSTSVGTYVFGSIDGAGYIMSIMGAYSTSYRFDNGLYANYTTSQGHIRYFRGFSTRIDCRYSTASTSYPYCGTMVCLGSNELDWSDPTNWTWFGPYWENAETYSLQQSVTGKGVITSISAFRYAFKLVVDGVTIFENLNAPRSGEGSDCLIPFNTSFQWYSYQTTYARYTLE